MTRRDLLLSCAAAPLVAPLAAAVSASPRYQPSWDSIDSRPSPDWYRDSKFGIFVHWGVYSVPAYAPVHSNNEMKYAEWYWHSLNNGPDSSTRKFHERVYGPNFSYFDFAPMFKAELYDPDQWADVMERSGAKYVALTSKHHEGFTLWKNAEANRAWGRPWNAVDIGPKRDVARELMEAGRRKGLRMGIYYSLYEWYNPLWLADKPRYVADHMFPQFKDAVTHLKPSVIFSDGEWELPSADWRSAELLAWLFNESPVAGEVVINDRWGKDTRHKHGGYYTTEYTSGMQASAHPWEESRGMAFSYGYNRAEGAEDYRTDRELLMMLIDIVSRGGNLLLDIGPRADGRIPPIMEERLLQLGEWLRVNGEAIYGTRARHVTRQWSEGRVPVLEEKEYMSEYPITALVDTPPAGSARVEAFFTSENGAVYAILPRRPLGEVVLRGIDAAAGVRVTLLEGGQLLESRMENGNLWVTIPDSLSAALPARQAWVLKLAGAK
jgi:alpha-L-fucosidase